MDPNKHSQNVTVFVNMLCGSTLFDVYYICMQWHPAGCVVCVRLFRHHLCSLEPRPLWTPCWIPRLPPLGLQPMTPCMSALHVSPSGTLYEPWTLCELSPFSVSCRKLALTLHKAFRQREEFSVIEITGGIKLHLASNSKNNSQNVKNKEVMYWCVMHAS